ncbi:MAG: ABC transporter ATP-binding protein [Rhizobiales bacterium]|nr:ABC transporter ATP-binding protein [Hyphomicrobiales bacterium]NRB12839.1 ABC transporter ATP-binding protein [Hyphomicrobiales bacterium]
MLKKAEKTTDLDQKGHVVLSHISHQYSEKIVLDDISFSIDRGEIICLLGSSGSGKSTLLRLIAGVETLNTGSISINNNIIVDETTYLAPEKRHIGMVFQDYALFPHLTVVKNIMFGLGRNGKITRQQAMEQLHYIGLTEYADEYPNVLSGGQQQRVALARTLVTKPEILLLDEPFSGLDSHLRTDLRIETKKLIKANNISAIFVTHDADEALYLADKIILINNHKIEQMGTPEQMLDKPETEFAAHYLRRYNEVDIKIENGIVIAPFGKFKSENLCCCTQTRLSNNHKTAKLLIAENDLHLESYDDPDEYDHQLEVEIAQINSYSEFSELHLIVAGLDKNLILRTSLREKQVKMGDKFNAHFNYKNLFIFVKKS